MSGSQDFSRFQIIGLRGATNIDVKIENNTLIMVGENGSGKTTFLRILFYFLSGRWASLAQFEFKSLSATIGDEEYTIEHSDLPRARSQLEPQILNRIPPSQRRRVSDLIDQGHFEEADELILRLTGRYPSRRISENLVLPLDKPSMPEKQLSQIQEKLAATLGAQILYLPTFRRIERELSSIFQGLDPDERRRTAPIARQSEDGPDYIELVEFGMNDVREAISSALEEIRNFQLLGTTRLSLSYLGDIFSKKYMNPAVDVIADASKETIEAVLNRVDNTILSVYDKSQLRNMIVANRQSSNTRPDHENIIYHYFTKLVEFQKELEQKEKNIRNFCKICSEYILDKEFIYESGKFLFSIMQKKQSKSIQLSDLSSGEKQIVSLFSHLYLSGREHFFVLIDEPELSLSVPWQRRFLVDIRNASFCSGLIAVTHSPFIYDNNLRKNTHGIGEFVKGPDWGNI